MKYVEWVEPDDESCQGFTINRIPVEEAIRIVHAGAAQVHQICGSDEDALGDFMACHWAKLVDISPVFGHGSAWTIGSPWLFGLRKPACPYSPTSYASSQWVLPSQCLLSRF